MCQVEICDQKHLMSYAVLKKFLPELVNTNIKYEDIFGSVNQQLIAIKLLTKSINQREIILEALG